LATTVSDVLKRKGYRVITVVPDQTIASVVDVLTPNLVGAALVAHQNGRIIGIISESDVIHVLAEFAVTRYCDSESTI
jgi:predicted transcriptional regulator